MRSPSLQPNAARPMPATSVARLLSASRIRWVLPLLVLLIGWSVCAWTGTVAWHRHRLADETAFRRMIANSEAQIRQRFTTYVDVLRSAAAFLRSSDDVSRAEWRRYADTLRLERQYPGVRGIGVVYAVPGERADAFVAEARRASPNFSLRHPPGSTTAGAELGVITFIEPEAENRAALGLDILGEVHRRQAALAARDTGEPRLSRHVALVQAGDAGAGALLLVPVYRSDAHPKTVEERRAALVGWAFAPVVISELIKSTIGAREERVALAVYDANPLHADALIYATAPAQADSYERVTSLTLAGLPVTIGWRRGPQYPHVGWPLLGYATIGGAIGSLLLAMLVASLTLAERRARGVAERVTSRMAAAQRELVAVSRLQRAVLDGTVHAIIGTTPDGVVTLFNAGAERMFGYAGDEVVGRFSLERLHVPAELHARASALWPDAPAGGSGWEALTALARVGKAEEREWTCVRKGGMLFSALVGVTALHDETGGVTGFLSIVQDLTERRSAEARAQRSQRLLETIARILPGLVGYWTADLRCAFANDAYVEWFGVSPDQARGMTMRDLLGPELFAANEPFVRGVLAGRPQQFERVLRKRNGTARHMWAQYIPDFDADRVTVRGFAVLVSDVTEMKAQEDALRASEARLRASLREVNDLKTAMDAHAIVAITDAQGVITYANDRFCTISGFTREELVGRTHRLVNSGRHPRAFFEQLWATITAGEIWRGEVCNRAKNGTLYWVDATIVPFLGDDGRPVQYIAIRTDITERRLLDENLAIARDQALEASRLKSEFLATISHEIRTPMNAIIGMAGLLADDPLTDEQANMVRTITSGAESLLTIINDILDFSRIESGQIRLDVAPFDLARVVEDTVSLLGPRAFEKGIALTYEIEPRPQTLLLGDAGRVRQVLMNLAGNAVKFTDAGSVTVKVAATTAADRVRVRLEVRDTGIGIPPEARSRLFRPFVQVDGTATRRFGGTGLGLAITHQLVSAMRGDIGFESQPARGSVFWVELTFKSGGALTASVPVAELPGCRVLVVARDATVRAMLVRQLVHCGAAPDAVEDARTALERLTAEGAKSCDAIVADVDPSVPDALEFAVAVGSDPRWRQRPFVLLVAAGTPHQAAAAEAIDGVVVVSKPATEARLARALQRGFARPAAALPQPAAAKRAPIGLHVLLVEDNLANQRVASLLLRKLGHTVEITSNGHHALDRLAHEAFDVVLMDCQMPLLDGYETTRWIRSGKVAGVQTRIPVIALTAYAREEDRERCYDAGMDAYVAKPIRLAELRAALEQVAPTVSVRGRTGASADDAALDADVVAMTRALADESGGSLLPQLIEAYLGDEPIALARVEAALAARLNEAADHVHALGGNAASFGGIEVRRVALEVEALVRDGRWIDAEATLVTLRAACERLRASIEPLRSPPS